LNNLPPKEKNFIGGTRKLKWKNLDVLQKAFEGIEEAKPDLQNYPPKDYIKKIGECYAVILVSLGDISPNMILEAITYDRPFIITQENGLMDRIKDIAITVDPQNIDDIKQKIKWLCEENNYRSQVEKIRNFNFTHGWEQIANEIIEVYNKI
jgi:glycosyltransferase involved in cell wall biosynthesis